MSYENKIKDLQKDSRIWGVHLLCLDIIMNEDNFRQIKRQLPSEEIELNRLMCISETLKYNESDLLTSVSFVTGLLIGLASLLVKVFGLEVINLTFYIIATILMISLVINRNNNNKNLRLLYIQLAIKEELNKFK